MNNLIFSSFDPLPPQGGINFGATVYFSYHTTKVPFRGIRGPEEYAQVNSY
jgi:hypothetical protein